jgi:two-component system cell cycle sensor histidine kinase/response regulator CckA
VFMTGGAFTARARAFLDEVPNRCIEKPFELARLRSVIRDVRKV